MSQTDETPKDQEEEETQKKSSVPWSAETDPVCCDIAAFFRENPDGPASVRSEVWRPGKEDPVAIGKTMSTLRTKSRQTDQTPLVKARLEALMKIPGFVAFLNQPVVSKPKPTPQTQSITRGLRVHIEQMRGNELGLEVALAQHSLSLAEKELFLFMQSKKRQRLM